MRLLLIEDDAAQCEIIQHRLTSRKPDAQIVVRSPDLQGPVAPEFLAQGFDAVLLGHGRGLIELRETDGNAPVLPPSSLSPMNAAHVDSVEAKEIGVALGFGARRDQFREILPASRRCGMGAVASAHEVAYPVPSDVKRSDSEARSSEVSMHPTDRNGSDF